MQTGGGIQNKILEAMALGKINVTTTLAGNSIYKALNYKHYLAEDNAEKMATLINNIVAHPEKYECIGKNAKELASEIYTWKNFGQILITTIQANLHS
jgi:glycosyltransferase involved in cell wall biosynthesis